jgi:hypothetical protein
MCLSDADKWAREVTSDLKALEPLGFLIMDWEQCDRCVSGVGEVLLAQCSECHVHHLLDNIVNLTSNDGSYPRYCGVDGYLHPDLTTVQAMGLKWLAAVDADRSIVTEENECAQQHSRKAWAVWAFGPKTTVLADGAVGVVIHVHL